VRGGAPADVQLDLWVICCKQATLYVLLKYMVTKSKIYV
jgi:hypothetical protein